MMIQLTDDKSKPVPQKPAKPQTKEQGTRVQTARPTQPQGNVPNPPSADDPRFDAKMDLEDKEETDAWLNDLNLPHAEAAILKDRTLRLLERARAKILAIVHEKRLDSADNKSRSKLSISGCVSKASRCKTFEVVMTMQCCGRVRVAFNTPCRLAGRASIFHIWKSLLKDPVLVEHEAGIKRKKKNKIFVLFHEKLLNGFFLSA
ncbi:hypothetical protein Esti_005863 [Eimeria stiedai]